MVFIVCPRRFCHNFIIAYSFSSRKGIQFEILNKSKTFSGMLCEAENLCYNGPI